MNILFHLHAYPNEVLAGAETMAHRIAKYLVSVGHKVKVLSRTAVEKKQTLDGVEVLQWIKDSDDSKEWLWSDLVVTHLVNTYYCFNRARQFNKKLVHLIHNSFADHLLRCRINANYLVYNSEYVKNQLGYNHKSCICIPPVDYREFKRCDKGEYITLVNLNENKGGSILIEIAKKLPQYKFMGVNGGYYEQIQNTTIANIKYIKPQKNIKAVYEKSKIILMPSEYESYGQVAIEAISCGVPVLNSKAQGLCSALGSASNAIDRNDIEAWCLEIDKLMTYKAYYKVKSDIAFERAKDLDPTKYLAGLNEFLTQINNIKQWQQ